MGTPRTARYVNEDAPKGTGQCHVNASMGLLELANRRAVNADGDAKYLSALRLYQLRLADKIEAEILGCSREERATKTALEGTLEGSKHERDMQRIRDGSGITESPPIRRPDPAFTLGGVSNW